MPDPIHASDASTPTILLVEDDLPLRDLFKLVLEQLGYIILTGGNGKEAMKQLRDNDDVALMITDLVMPDQEGMETIVCARKEFPKLKILVVSGYSEYFRTAILCGAYDCLLKPIATNVLKDKVASIMGSRAAVSVS